ncbi:lipocalin family protein [Chitinophaga sp. XS-30]|uniref:lipocalin family protein n=1 Tax=Chitinophaga sp. XS-30 TaxID=2604421 RepID=UPI0011DD83F4|nr:lipocalin family protein [Chitinophaga sp. XS-30]QEH42866.1 hypothetical protein FW415_19125 [Chitinophaga sp. XS-30]
MFFIIYAALVPAAPVCAQEKSDKTFKALICKEWKLKFYEEDGEKFPPAPDQSGDRMFFYQDNTVKSIEQKKIQHGTWAYDEVKKILTVVDNETKEKATLKVIALAPDKCVLDYKDPEGSVLRMHMVPVK